VTGHTPYPLEWPLGSARCKRPMRSRFKRQTVAQALTHLQDELRRFKADHVTISTNVAVRRDGLPYSGLAEPEDSGVAVYFTRRGKPYAMALDMYDRVACNMHALAMIIDAYRSIERHGGGALLGQAVAGFAALPPANDRAAKLQALVDGATTDGERRAAQAALDVERSRRDGSR